MYVKIVVTETDRNNPCLSVKGNSQCEVVPTTSKIIECVSVEYSKFAFKDLDDFLTITKRRPLTIISSEDQDFNGPLEFLYITVRVDRDDPDGRNFYAAIDCDMYIMNDSGKTVDFVRCGYPKGSIFDKYPNESILDKE